MKRVLVTGGSGFLGRVLCARLSALGVSVMALHRRRAEGPWHEQLILDPCHETPPAAALADVDTVFHLAGHAHTAPRDGDDNRHQQISVEGTRRLLASLSPQVARIVYASSVKAMGESTPLSGLDEDAACHPSTEYGRARRAAEQLLLAASAGTPPATVLRLPLLYGPGVRGNLRTLMRAVRARWLPRWTSDGGRRSMLHVDDAARAAIAVAEQPIAAGRIYLLSEGGGYTTAELVDLMYAAIGTTPRIPMLQAALPLLKAAARGGDALARIGLPGVPIDSERLAKLDGCARYHAARIRDEIGFTPEHTLAASLPAMFEALD